MCIVVVMVVVVVVYSELMSGVESTMVVFANGMHIQVVLSTAGPIQSVLQFKLVLESGGSFGVVHPLRLQFTLFNLAHIVVNLTQQVGLVRDLLISAHLHCILLHLG